MPRIDLFNIDNPMSHKFPTTGTTNHTQQVFEVDMLAKPRMTRRDKWMKRKCVMNYRALKDELTLLARRDKFELPEKYLAVVILKMPKSWTNKRKEEMNSEPHRQKPDADNILKAINDIFLGDDSSVWDCRIQKRWGRKGSLTIYY